MTYRMQDRLAHAGNRMSQNNHECVTFVSGTSRVPLDVSPILISSDELNPGGGSPSLIQTQRQDWVAWVCREGPKGERGLGPLYPPVAGNYIIRADGTRFTVTSMGMDEPPFCPVNSDRTRVIIHTIKTK